MTVRICLFAFLLFTACSRAHAIDVVKADIGESTNDKRAHFKEDILKQALELTKPTHGDYELKTRKQFMNAKRAFSELSLGDAINAYFALTNPTWESAAYPIKVPVRCGASSYRLLLINANEADKFRNITDIEGLKKLKVGLNDGWTTYSILKNQNFNIVKVGSYDSMFPMLLAGRFDYLLRAVSEVYDEFESRADKLPNLMIEPSIAVHIPSATYLFVSNNSPKIAERLKLGIQLMERNGDLDRACETYFMPAMLKAELAKRKIIDISPEFSLKHFDYLDQKTKYYFAP